MGHRWNGKATFEIEKVTLNWKSLQLIRKDKHSLMVSNGWP